MCICVHILGCIGRQPLGGSNGVLNPNGEGVLRCKPVTMIPCAAPAPITTSSCGERHEFEGVDLIRICINEVCNK